MQSKMGATWAYALGRFVVNLGHSAVLKTAFLASDLDRNHLKGQGALNENHFAVGPAGNALGIHVQRLDPQPALRQVRADRVFGCGGSWGKGEVLFAHLPIVSGCRTRLERLNGQATTWRGQRACLAGAPRSAI